MMMREDATSSLLHCNTLTLRAHNHLTAYKDKLAAVKQGTYVRTYVHSFAKYSREITVYLPINTINSINCTFITLSIDFLSINNFIFNLFMNFFFYLFIYFIFLKIPGYY